MIHVSFHLVWGFRYMFKSVFIYLFIYIYTRNYIIYTNCWYLHHLELNPPNSMEPFSVSQMEEAVRKPSAGSSTDTSWTHLHKFPASRCCACDMFRVFYTSRFRSSRYIQIYRCTFGTLIHITYQFIIPKIPLHRM